jgi:hypothetical protein
LFSENEAAPELCKKTFKVVPSDGGASAKETPEPEKFAVIPMFLVSFAATRYR